MLALQVSLLLKKLCSLCKDYLYYFYLNMQYFINCSYFHTISDKKKTLIELPNFVEKYPLSFPRHIVKPPSLNKVQDLKKLSEKTLSAVF